MNFFQLDRDSPYQTLSRAEMYWVKETRRLAKQPGIVLDLGGGSPNQGVICLADLGEFTSYFCLDIRSTAFPNIIADGHCIPLADSTIQFVYCNAVLEHVAEPQQVVNEIYRVLVHSGHALIAVPFIYPYHDQVDYYRFTDSALAYMFQKFDTVKIAPLGDYFVSSLMHLTGFNFPLARRLDPLLNVVRLSTDWGLYWYQKLSGRNMARTRRTLKRSPVGWYVYCHK